MDEDSSAAFVEELHPSCCWIEIEAGAETPSGPGCLTLLGLIVCVALVGIPLALGSYGMSGLGLLVGIGVVVVALEVELRATKPAQPGFGPLTCDRLGLLCRGERVLWTEIVDIHTRSVKSADRSETIEVVAIRHRDGQVRGLKAVGGVKDLERMLLTRLPDNGRIPGTEAGESQLGALVHRARDARRE